jgi:hypothetical protein
MAWTLNGIRIYVQDEIQSGKQIIARLQPLSGGTVKQIFGYDDDIFKITGKIVGNTVRDTLDGYKETGTAYALVGPEGAIGNFYVSNISFKRDNTYYQTIDLTGGNTCTSPVYTVEIELM